MSKLKNIIAKEGEDTPLGGRLKKILDGVTKAKAKAKAKADAEKAKAEANEAAEKAKAEEAKEGEFFKELQKMSNTLRNKLPNNLDPNIKEKIITKMNLGGIIDPKVVREIIKNEIKKGEIDGKQGRIIVREVINSLRNGGLLRIQGNDAKATNVFEAKKAEEVEYLRYTIPETKENGDTRVEESTYANPKGSNYHERISEKTSREGSSK